MECYFPNDNGVTILAIDNNLTHQYFKWRYRFETLMRNIVAHLMRNKIIKNNIIDLGAWIGDNALPWCKNIDGVVYTIDPSPENCKYIRDMAVLNDIPNIKVFERAISNTTEILSTNDDLFHCSFVFDNPQLNGKNKVISTTLDELYKSRQIENVDFIHLDVEGMEYKVIEGATQLIETYKPIIIFEQHLDSDDYMGLSTFLVNKNYKIYLIKENLEGCLPDCCNFIAIPTSILDRVSTLITSQFGEVIIPIM